MIGGALILALGLICWTLRRRYHPVVTMIPGLAEWVAAGAHPSPGVRVAVPMERGYVVDTGQPIGSPARYGMAPFSAYARVTGPAPGGRSGIMVRLEGGSLSPALEVRTWQPVPAW